MADPTQILSRFETLAADRSTWERNWQDIRELVRPTTSDFTKTTTPGQSKVDGVYDGSAREACKELAAALQSYMSSPTERWFSLKVVGDDDANRDPDTLAWLEHVADEIYEQYSNDETMFTSAYHEGYLDIAAFGNTIVNQEWNQEKDGLVFRTMPVSTCYYAEDDAGLVSTLFRLTQKTKNQLIERFGTANLPKKVMDANDVTKFEVVHAVYPRADRNTASYTQKNMPFASCWVLRQDKRLLEESGYRSFPYHVARWTKVADETYGRGPADDCLPDIRMLNRMEYTLIKAGQKQVDPPLTVPNDGFLLPIKTAPGSLNFKEPGAENLEPLKMEGNLPWGEDKAAQKREFIRQCFFADWVKLMPKKERQTAYEISELVEQQLRMMAPMLGRIQTELLRPTIARSYELLLAARRFAPAPPGAQRRTLSVVYVSAAARAQEGTKAIAMGRYAQELLPMAQVDPSVLDIIHPDRFASELAAIRGISRKVLRTPDELVEVRQARAQEKQAAQLAQIAAPASQAVKNLADANKAGQIF